MSHLCRQSESSRQAGIVCLESLLKSNCYMDETPANCFTFYIFDFQVSWPSACRITCAGNLNPASKLVLCFRNLSPKVQFTWGKLPSFFCFLPFDFQVSWTSASRITCAGTLSQPASSHCVSRIPPNKSIYMGETPAILCEVLLADANTNIGSIANI